MELWRAEKRTLKRKGLVKEGDRLIWGKRRNKGAVLVRKQYWPTLSEVTCYGWPGYLEDQELRNEI